MSTPNRTKQERMLLMSRLVGAVEQRVTNPRGSRYQKYAKRVREWVEASPGTNTQYNYPHKVPRLLIDRAGTTVYGLFWNNRLLKLGKTVWTDPSQAVAAFNKYVSNVLILLEDDELSPLAQDLVSFAKEHGHRTVKEITVALRECGALQVRELETIPMPPEEE
ncbi:hypothetical protein EKK58_00740 [Candidatus Dependentiae bacterium]|nr:MAG: hypothetical protein EKK58_00740 [Candidatus Dependentiae bacterium]